MKVLVIEKDKEPEVREIMMSLVSLQRIVGGLIEVVGGGEVDFVVNEEGRINDLPVSRRVQYQGGYLDIHGTFILLRTNSDGDFAALTDEDVETYKKMFSLENSTPFVVFTR